MKSGLFRSRLGLATAPLTAALGLLCAAGASAQDSTLTSAAVGTCNLKGSVSITIAGLTKTVPLSCLNKTAQAASGSDDSALVGTHTLGVPGVANVAAVEAPFGLSDWSNAPNLTVLTGDAGASDVNVAQDGIQADEVAGRMSCSSTAGNPLTTCRVAMTLGSLHIGGQPMPLPPDPIPINTTLAVAGLNLKVQPLGLPLLNVPLSGTVVLNQVKFSGGGTWVGRIEHAPIAADLQGQVSVAGIGLVKVAVKVEDYDEGTWERPKEGYPIPPPPPEVVPTLYNDI